MMIDIGPDLFPYTPAHAHDIKAKVIEKFYGKGKWKSSLQTQISKPYDWFDSKRSRVLLRNTKQAYDIEMTAY